MSTGVLIAGGGIGGLAAACALRRIGVDAIVLERAPELRPVGGGLLLSSNATRVLAALDLLEELRKSSSPAPAWRLLDRRGALLSEVLHREDPGPISLLRATLQRAFLDRLPPGSVRFGAVVRSVEVDDSRARVRLETGEEHVAALVVGADGLRSVVRRVLFAAAPLRYSGYVGWRGVAEMDAAPAGALSESWGVGQRFGLAAAGPGRTYWYASDNRPAHRLAPAPDCSAELRGLFADWHEPVADLLAGTPPARIHFDPIYEVSVPRHLSRGRAVLLGDAAHAMTPNLGQGACLALEDAWVLAGAIARQGPTPAALETYSAQRRPRAVRVQHSSRALGWIIQRPGRRLSPVRNWIIRHAPRTAAETFFARLTGFVPDPPPGARAPASN